MPERGRSSDTHFCDRKKQSQQTDNNGKNNPKKFDFLQ